MSAIDEATFAKVREEQRMTPFHDGEAMIRATLERYLELRGSSRNTITELDLEERARIAGDRGPVPGLKTFDAPPPDEYEGRVVVLEVVRLGDHAHITVCTGRQHAKRASTRPTYHRGEAGRLVMAWHDWLHWRAALDAGPAWTWIAEVEVPTPAQIERYTG